MSKAMASEAKFPPGYFNGNSWEVTIELFICYKALQLNFNAARSIRVQQPSSDLSKAEVKVQDSHPYRRTDSTVTIKSLAFISLDTLDFQTLLIFHF